MTDTSCAERSRHLSDGLPRRDPPDSSAGSRNGIAARSWSPPADTSLMPTSSARLGTGLANVDDISPVDRAQLSPARRAEAVFTASTTIPPPCSSHACRCGSALWRQIGRSRFSITICGRATAWPECRQWTGCGSDPPVRGRSGDRTRRRLPRRSCSCAVDRVDTHGSGCRSPERPDDDVDVVRERSSALERDGAPLTAWRTLWRCLVRRVVRARPGDAPVMGRSSKRWQAITRDCRPRSSSVGVTCSRERRGASVCSTGRSSFRRCSSDRQARRSRRRVSTRSSATRHGTCCGARTRRRSRSSPDSPAATRGTETGTSTCISCSQSECSI